MNSEEAYGVWEVNTNGYSTSLGQLASTTGNVYGIYDMSGGAWDYTSAYYNYGTKALKNGNGNNAGVYFEEIKKESSESYYKLKPMYEKYWEIYEVNEDAKKNNSIEVGGEKLTQEELWNASKKSSEVEQKRYDLTKKAWDNLEKKKGIGRNEITEHWSYRGLIESGLVWKVNTTDTENTYGEAWNNDMVCIGYSLGVFLGFGGGRGNGMFSGVLSSDTGARISIYGDRVSSSFGILIQWFTKI